MANLEISGSIITPEKYFFDILTKFRWQVPVAGATGQFSTEPDKEARSRLVSEIRTIVIARTMIAFSLPSTKLATCTTSNGIKFLDMPQSEEALVVDEMEQHLRNENPTEGHDDIPMSWANHFLDTERTRFYDIASKTHQGCRRPRIAML